MTQEDGPTWAALDAEADARTPSPAQRAASRRQGRALLRAARAAWPARWLTDLADAARPPHHPVVLGATAAAAGCSPGEAALIAVYLTVTGPAIAAVRLLALDPIEVSATIARLAGAIEAAAARAAAAEADGAPLLRHDLDVSGTDEVSLGPAVLSGCRTAGSLLWVEPDGRMARQMPSGCSAGVAVMPLTGPAVLVTALARDARTLRQRLRLPDGPGLPAMGSVLARPVPVG